ncbi:MAG: hypothetical protein AAGA56_15935 [Myxococcota bacterium]
MTTRALLLLALFASSGCLRDPQPKNGGATPKPLDAGEAGVMLSGPDRSLCQWQNRPDLEVIETAGNGASGQNIRRVYKTFANGTRRILLCRELDSNLDGKKDSVRKYNEKGEIQEEYADTNFDGLVDTWHAYSEGKRVETNIDRNHDGRPEERQIFTQGRLTRIERDANHDGKVDHWEIYRNGRLERMGVDLDPEDDDVGVDRWDKDVAYRKELDRKKKEREERQKAKDAERTEAAQEDASEAGTNEEAKPADDAPTESDG